MITAAFVVEVGVVIDSRWSKKSDFRFCPLDTSDIPPRAPAALHVRISHGASCPALSAR